MTDYNPQLEKPIRAFDGIAKFNRESGDKSKITLKPVPFSMALVIPEGDTAKDLNLALAFFEDFGKDQPLTDYLGKMALDATHLIAGYSHEQRHIHLDGVSSRTPTGIVYNGEVSSVSYLELITNPLHTGVPIGTFTLKEYDPIAQRRVNNDRLTRGLEMIFQRKVDLGDFMEDPQSLIMEAQNYVHIKHQSVGSMA
ncbi:MAG: hypothetical protein WCK90_04005 [archaeon]